MCRGWAGGMISLGRIHGEHLNLKLVWTMACQMHNKPGAFPAGTPGKHHKVTPSTSGPTTKPFRRRARRTGTVRARSFSQTGNDRYPEGCGRLSAHPLAVAE